MYLSVLFPGQYTNIEFYKIKYKKGGQVGMTLLYSRLQVGHCNE